jgi:hypothetical protein
MFKANLDEIYLREAREEIGSRAPWGRGASASVASLRIGHLEP